MICHGYLISRLGLINILLLVALAVGILIPFPLLLHQNKFNTLPSLRLRHSERIFCDHLLVTNNDFTLRHHDTGAHQYDQHPTSARRAGKRRASDLEFDDQTQNPKRPRHEHSSLPPPPARYVSTCS